MISLGVLIVLPSVIGIVLLQSSVQSLKTNGIEPLCTRHMLISAVIYCRHASVSVFCKYQTNYSPIGGEDTFSPWLILWRMSPMSTCEFVDVLMKGSVYQATSTNQHVDPVSLTGKTQS